MCVGEDSCVEECIESAFGVCYALCSRGREYYEVVHVVGDLEPHCSQVPDDHPYKPLPNHRACGEAEGEGGGGVPTAGCAEAEVRYERGVERYMEKGVRYVYCGRP